eukprot:1011577-Prymnesium_polylepis.1
MNEVIGRLCKELQSRAAANVHVHLLDAFEISSQRRRTSSPLTILATGCTGRASAGTWQHQRLSRANLHEAAGR